MTKNDPTIIMEDLLDVDAFSQYMESQSKETKVYIGCDSVRSKVGENQWNARFSTVIVVHIDGCHGGKVFTMWERVKHILEGRWEVKLHLDLNPDESFGSNVAHQAASGFVLGITGMEAECKPNAWSASFAADRVAHGKL